MNKLKLKERTQDYIIYLYQPEGKGSYGEIRMNSGDERAFVVSRSDEDSCTGRYAFKATRAVEKCVKTQKFPLEFIQAWY